jgi:predicted MPP superfamily phosphohydrolase
MSPISRRDFLRTAGGVTFLALTPLRNGAFAAPESPARPRLPFFTALPYIQPGANSQLVPGRESMIVAWQTQDGEASFAVEYGDTTAYGRSAQVQSVLRAAGRGGDTEQHLNWHAELTNLELGRRYVYRVTGNGQTLAEGFFTTRQPRGQRTRFVAFGDNSYGDISDRAIAYHAYQQHPDFVMNCGDNVYDSGLNNEYQRFFFPVYNADITHPTVGAPLLRSVPFYTVIANHDVQDKDANNHECADFGKNPDALAYYTAMHLPLNGPAAPTYPTPTQGPAERLDAFRQAAGPRFPRMANYSFDYGDVHFLCLDSNLYIDPNDAALRAWVDADLRGTDATWKFVICHHPPFNVGGDHFVVQHMRMFAPLFETHGVDFVLSGHEHNYQRPRPLKFAPAGPGMSNLVAGRTRKVPGTFTIDRKFDGISNTQASGVIYVVTGAGGKHLYDPGYTDAPHRWLHEEDGNADYMVTMVTDRHSLTVFDVDGERLTLTQVDEAGHEFDHITVTKDRRKSGGRA